MGAERREKRLKNNDTDALAVVLAVFGVLALFIGLGLLLSWGALAAWNLFASSAGLAATVPINWGTVFGLMLVIIFARQILRRKKE